MPKACALSSLNNYLQVLLHKVTVLFPPRHALCVKNCTTPQYASTICCVLTAPNTPSLQGVGARNMHVTEWLILCVKRMCARINRACGLFFKTICPCYIVKISIIVLQNTSPIPTPSSENRCPKAWFQALFSVLHILFYSLFECQSIKLHLFAFLFGAKMTIFRRPQNQFLHTKSRFLAIFSPKSSTILLSIVKIQALSKTRFAPFSSAFCTIQPCIQQQNALRLAAKRKVFCCILHGVLLHFSLNFVLNYLFFGVNHSFSC